MGRAVDLHRKAHEAFNARDWDVLRALMKDDVVYTDNPRGITMKSADELLGWMQEWTTGMSDAKPDEPRYIDGGDYSVALFRGRGTNDGPMGTANATGNRLDTPFCEVLHCDTDGKFDKGEIYYDAMTMMVQLGVMEPPQM